MDIFHYIVNVRRISATKYYALFVNFSDHSLNSFLPVDKQNFAQQHVGVATNNETTPAKPSLYFTFSSSLSLYSYCF